MKSKKLNRVLIVMIFITTGLFAYIQIISKNTPAMTGRQKALRAFYPVWMGLTKLASINSKIINNKQGIEPRQSFYRLSTILNNGHMLRFDSLKGKKILLVNTASNCGYTNQYEDLQKIYDQYKNRLVVIGFPSNDFKEQETGNDETIAQFCKVNFGVTFPLATKSSVIKGNEQNIVFQWLTDKSKNGWNEQPPAWNFSKYLVDENGVLKDYFDPSISPLDSTIIKAIQE